MTADQPPGTNELQTALDDLGADIDLDREGVDVGFDQVTDNGMQFTEATIVKPVISRGDEPVGEVTKEVMLDGTHAVVTVQKRPECPNCQYIPTQEEDAITLTGRCIECNVLTCANCGTHCYTCDRPLCDHHSDGYGMMGEVLCPKHRQDIEREKEFSWKIQVWKQHLEEEDILLGHETEREIAFKELELDAEIKRYQMELEAEIERRQQELAEFEAKSQHLDRVRQQELERQRFEFDKVATMLEERRKATRLALDEEIERRQQELKEWEAQTDHEIAQAEQALKEREQQFTENKFEKEHEFDKEKFRKEHEFEREKFDREQTHKEAKFDKEHALNEKKHRTERDDKMAKRDIEQQKVGIKRKKAEVDAWVKKRRQKLREYKAKNQGEVSSSTDGPGWEELYDVKQGLEEMPQIEVKN